MHPLPPSAHSAALSPPTTMFSLEGWSGSCCCGCCSAGRRARCRWGRRGAGARCMPPDLRGAWRAPPPMTGHAGDVMPPAGGRNIDRMATGRCWVAGRHPARSGASSGDDQSWLEAPPTPIRPRFDALMQSIGQPLPHIPAPGSTRYLRAPGKCALIGRSPRTTLFPKPRASSLQQPSILHLGARHGEHFLCCVSLFLTPLLGVQDVLLAEPAS